MTSAQSSGRTDLPDAAAVILAAGKSTRMKSSLPKPLHPLAGAPMTRHVIDACRAAGIARIVVVIGHEAEQVRSGLGEDVEYAHQPTQRGTGHAALCAQPTLGSFRGPIVFIAGDVPLIEADTIRDLIAAATQADGSSSTVCGAMLVATSDDPTGYGRVILTDDGSVERIVEQKDANEAEAAIRLWNPSVYCFQSDALWQRLSRIGSTNAQGEQYLTDVVALTRDDGERILPLHVAEDEVMGVNTRVDLAEAERLMRRRILIGLMLSGVTIVDPSSTYVDAQVTIEPDTVIHPNSYLYGRTRIGANCIVGPMALLRDALIGDDCRILASQISESTLGSGVRVGPYANLRPGCVIGDRAKIGDFVEMKNATIGSGVAASHLSYVGDAIVGDRTNIGAGTVTCNYDGVDKHRTVIGNDAFIGSNTVIVAPLAIGDGALTAAGSVLTRDVPADALAVARSRQENKEGWARRKRSSRTAKEVDGG